jgi:hypothetical protein
MSSLTKIFILISMLSLVSCKNKLDVLERVTLCKGQLQVISRLVKLESDSRFSKKLMVEWCLSPCDKGSDTCKEIVREFGGANDN